MIPFCILPGSFDPQRLAADSDQVLPEEWSPHYNQRDYEGKWDGAALRSLDGAAGNLYPDLTERGSFTDTSLLERCLYFRTVLAFFQCPLRSVRLLRLQPGARIREHCDFKLSLEDGEARLHIPITTNPDVDFVVSGTQLVMNPGEVWYINFSLPHRVANRGATERIHLVIDCIPNDWLRAQLHTNLSPAAVPECPSTSAPAEKLPSSSDALERFRLFVLEDAALQEEFRNIGEQELFIQQVVSRGNALGFGLAAVDVREAMRANRRAALEGRLL